MKKTIVYLTHARIPSEKTPFPFIRNTCDGFVDEGWNVELWSARRHNPPFEKESHVSSMKGRFLVVPISVVDWMRFIGKVGFICMVATYNVAVARLWWRRRREGVICYAHDFRDVIVLLLVGAPVVCEIHDFFESSISVLNRFAFTRIQSFVVTNAIKARILREKYHVPEARILIQQNAVAVEQFNISLSRAEARTQLNLPQDALLAMYTGHLYEWKGVYTLAKAARFLPKDIHVYFIGGTDFDRKALQKFVAEEHLSRITFIEQQAHEKMPLFQKAADVVVLPNTATVRASREETSPVKLFEYLASGTPIVASDVPSIREIVTENEVMFAHPDDPQDLARTISSAIESGGARSANALALARTHSWSARANAISTFLKN